MFVYLNGEFLKTKKALISPYDYGFLYGYGLFETIRVYNGYPFALGRHLNRLYRSAQILKIPLPAIKGLKEACQKLIKLNKTSDAKMRITVSPGISEGSPQLPPAASPTVFIFTQPFKGYPLSFYRSGLKAVILKERVNNLSIFPQLKTTAFFNRLLATEELKKRGVEEGFYLNLKEELTEATFSNIFLVKKNKIITPPPECGLLPGITREIILEIAPFLGFEAEEKLVKKEEIREAEEIFITSTLREVMPVVEVEGEKIGNGRPGPVYQKVYRAYKELVKKSAV